MWNGNKQMVLERLSGWISALLQRQKTPQPVVSARSWERREGTAWASLSRAFNDLYQLDL